MKEIILIRDPRDVFCSHMAYFRRGRDKAFNDISFSCEELLRVYRSASGMEVFVKYENMLANDRSTYERLSAFLEVPDLGRGNRDREDAVFQRHATSSSPSEFRWPLAEAAGR